MKVTQDTVELIHIQANGTKEFQNAALNLLEKAFLQEQKAILAVFYGADDNDNLNSVKIGVRYEPEAFERCGEAALVYALGKYCERRLGQLEAQAELLRLAQSSGPDGPFGTAREKKIVPHVNSDDSQGWSVEKGGEQSLTSSGNGTPDNGTPSEQNSSVTVAENVGAVVTEA